jgi:protein SCO1/2
MKKKGIFLFLLILLPVLIFLFLKGFGRNEFSIPVYYEQGLGDSLSTPCLDRAKQQYYVQSPFSAAGKIKIIHFERVDGPLTLFRMEELERVQDVFGEDPEVELVTSVNGVSMKVQEIEDYSARVFFNDAFWKRQELDSTAWAELKYCDVAMSDLDNRVVLVDKQNRIRGYYNITERDETDRLILELRILKTEIIEENG